MFHTWHIYNAVTAGSSPPEASTKFATGSAIVSRSISNQVGKTQEIRVGYFFCSIYCAVFAKNLLVYLPSTPTTQGVDTCFGARRDDAAASGHLF